MFAVFWAWFLGDIGGFVNGLKLTRCCVLRPHKKLPNVQSISEDLRQLFVLSVTSIADRQSSSFVLIGR